MPLTPSTTNTHYPHFSSPIALSAHLIGNASVWLCHWGFDQLMRFTDPLVYGRSKAMDQFLVPIEILARPFRLIFGLTGFLIGAPLAIAGQIIKVPTAYFSKKDFEYYHNTYGYDPTPIISGTELKITTWNLAAMHSGLRRFNQMRPNESRMKEVINYLKHTNEDIICLQEVFTEAATKILVEGLEDEYPYIVHNVGKNVIGINSGLMLLSKYPIDHLEFETFTSRIGLNQLSQKGVLGAIITAPDNKKIVVMNAHFDAGGITACGGDVMESKLKQMDQLFKMRDKLENIAAEYNHKIVSVFAADANLNSQKLTDNQDEPVIKSLLTQYAINPATDRKTCTKIHILNKRQVKNNNFDNSKSGGDIIETRKINDMHPSRYLSTNQEVMIASHRHTTDKSNHFPSTLKVRFT